MSTVYIEVCTRAGQPDRALDMYHFMQRASGDRLRPSVHTYTAALRAAAADEASCPQAMAIWTDMLRAGCQPSGTSGAVRCAFRVCMKLSVTALVGSAAAHLAGACLVHACMAAADYATLPCAIQLI